MLTRRTYAQVRDSAYYDPQGTADYLRSIGAPFPLDLQVELQSMGFLVDDLEQEPVNLGFSLEEPEFYSETLSV